MADNVVTRLEVKSLDFPDDRRTPDKTTIDVNTLGDYSIGRLTFQPGWSWSECIKPVVGTDLCEVNHVGYCIAGEIEVQTEDGTRVLITAGDTYTIPPRHDAHVVGDKPFVTLELVGAPNYAMPNAAHLQRPRLR
ncbi:cupin domain-containing protein [Leifsonia kafniensis]|uniref:Cupin domain-containing protein n=1 Tax=Leifsonia kafniensis TaxID=475957 RepID=A0ABP7L3B5_9MICO